MAVVRFAFIALTMLGAILTTVIFAVAFTNYQRVDRQLESVYAGLEDATNLQETLTAISKPLLSLLFQLAYLGLALAASATILRYGMNGLLRSSSREEGKGRSHD